jgi:hypothetical protein
VSETPNGASESAGGEVPADKNPVAPDGAVAGEVIADEGPGWMPAIMAGTLIFGMICFIGCSVLTWLLFQQRSELAVKTMRGTYMPSVEQSLLKPEEKQATLKLLEEFTSDLERGRYEDWQAGGVMTRMIRLPVLQWGDLSAIESFIVKNATDFPEDATTQLSRLRWAAEIDKATGIDFDHVLDSVVEYDDSLIGRHLQEPLQVESVKQVVARSREVADRLQIPSKRFDDVWIDKIVSRQIKAGIESGAL